MKKLQLILLLALTSCIKDTPLQTITYSVNSVRIDDDSEYHLILINNNTGVVKTANDLNDYDLPVRFGVIAKPYVLETYRESPYYNKRELFLPIGYKIETFDD